MLNFNISLWWFFSKIVEGINAIMFLAYMVSTPKSATLALVLWVCARFWTPIKSRPIMVWKKKSLCIFSLLQELQRCYIEWKPYRASGYHQTFGISIETRNGLCKKLLNILWARSTSYNLFFQKVCLLFSIWFSSECSSKILKRRRVHNIYPRSLF